MSYNLLKGKKGLGFGALNEKSIAWQVAVRAVEEGAEVVLTNTAMAARMGEQLSWLKNFIPFSSRPMLPVSKIRKT